MTRPKPVVMCILDGWGYRKEKENNAIEMGNTPVWHELIKTYPHAMIQTSGVDVGLPDGQMGNSEVGHMNLGAGRVVMQDLPRIDSAIADGSLARNSVLTDLIQKMHDTAGTCHVMGLLGSGGVHAQQRHILALVRVLNDARVPVALHGFLDGRDTPPDSAKGFIDDLLRDIADMSFVKLVSLSGRYYAMDRDNRWERVDKAYRALVNADAPRFETADQAMALSYENKVFDEFVIPCVLGGYDGMHDGDAVIMANYRSDRSREITRMLLQPDFDAVSRNRVVRFSDAVAMTEYSVEHNQWMRVLFPPDRLTRIFGEVVADAGLTQLRIAETEKYAHVTFFFNGGKETLFSGEERILIPSPQVATYDLKPEMSAYEVTDKLVDAIENDRFDVIVVNYANGDMVGHTGDLNAAIQAVEAVDTCLGRVVAAVKSKGGVMFVSADHGNAERMKDDVGNTITAHTVGPVQGVLINATGVTALSDGCLSDVAPTLLDILNLPQPSEMTGCSLIRRG